MKTLYIVRGPAGSGKSTYCKNVLIPKIKEQFGVDVVNHENDAYFTDEKGNYNWNAKDMPKAIAVCFANVKHDLETKGVAIVSNTFIKRNTMKEYYDLAHELGATVKVIRMETWYGSVHNVPAFVVKNMRNGIEPIEGEEIVK
jgi:predicted kinase